MLGSREVVIEGRSCLFGIEVSPYIDEPLQMAGVAFIIIELGLSPHAIIINKCEGGHYLVLMGVLRHNLFDKGMILNDLSVTESQQVSSLYLFYFFYFLLLFGRLGGIGDCCRLGGGSLGSSKQTLSHILFSFILRCNQFLLLFFPRRIHRHKDRWLDFSLLVGFDFLLFLLLFPIQLCPLLIEEVLEGGSHLLDFIGRKSQFLLGYLLDFYLLILLGTSHFGILHEGIQERKTLLELSRYFKGVFQCGIVTGKPLGLQGSLIELDISVLGKSLKDQLSIRVIFESRCTGQLNQSINDPFLRTLMLVIIVQAFQYNPGEVFQFVAIVFVIIRAHLTDDPRCSLYDKICGHYLLQEFDHFDDYLFSKVFMRVVILNDQPEEVIEDIFRKVLTAQFEQDLHGIEVPLMSGRKSFSQLGDFDHQVVPEVVVGGTMEGVEHFGDNNFHVVLGSHPEQQFKGLPLQGLVFTLQALHHYQLVFVKQFGVIAVKQSQGLNAEILHVIAAIGLEQL